MKRYYFLIGIALVLAIIFIPIPIPLVVLFFTVAWILIAFKKHCSYKISKHTLKEIDKMTGEEFEYYVAYLFRLMGYHANVTKTSGDYGADVIATRFIGGRNERTAIQCKRYQGKVGIAAIQEVIGAQAYYKTQRAFVITNSYFTDAAKNLAFSSKVTLWDRDILQTQLRKLLKPDEEYESFLDEKN